IVISRPLEHDPPQVVIGPPDSLRGKRVLLVDETCDSGDTIRLALHELQQVGPAEIRSAVSFRTGSYMPDFFAFETDKAIVLPWDREIIENGELVPRPDLSPAASD
ncbi:MAG TPA: phosphoribosyltransferase family protein, partial [Gemmatimonadales bacterium]|nr:phosphoribosyltransferase family protein [Gemmatimonadales bacterium]